MLKKCWTRIWFPSRISVLSLKRKTINWQIREERPEAMRSSTDEAIGQTSPGATVLSLGPPTEPPVLGILISRAPWIQQIQTGAAHRWIQRSEQSAVNMSPCVLRIEVTSTVLGTCPHRIMVGQRDPPGLDLDWSGDKPSLPLSGPLPTQAVKWKMTLSPPTPGWTRCEALTHRCITSSWKR